MEKKHKCDIELVDGEPTNVSGRTILDGEYCTISPEAYQAILRGGMILDGELVATFDLAVAAGEIGEA